MALGGLALLPPLILLVVKLVLCCWWKRQKRRDTFPYVKQQQETPSAELVKYEVPVFDRQDNMAGDGNIVLCQNVAYEKVHK